MFKSKLFKNLMVFGIVAILSVPLFSSNFSFKANDDCGLAKVTNYSNLNALSAADDLNGGWKIFSWKIWGYVGNAFEFIGNVVDAVEHVQEIWEWIGDGKVSHSSFTIGSHNEQLLLLQDLN